MLELWSKHPDKQASLEAWYGVVRKVAWKNPAEMKAVCANADVVGRRTVFNVAGNKYRLIARVNYLLQKIFILYIPTLAEYDRGGWKK